MANHITLQSLTQLKQQGEKFTCLTAYDASFAQLLSTAGVEVLLIGDTLGTVIQGYDTTIPVRLEDIVYHTQCVSRGNRGSFLLADLPFMSYGTATQALDSAAQIMQAGAHMVKLEGGGWVIEIIQRLTECGIPVCGHIGLTPQSVHKLGGYKVQGRDPEQAQKLKENALALQQAGADLLVLECVPSNLAAEITKSLSIPTIGIGAGPHCDAQVLVLYDMLGLGQDYKFIKNFLPKNTLKEAITAYIKAVKNNEFPGSEHAY